MSRTAQPVGAAGAALGSYDGRVMADFIPLARAAALVHERLFPEQPSKDYKTLDVIALALSVLIPLYQRDMESGALRALEETEITAGRFTRGATTLEFPNRPPLRFLVVSRESLAGAIQKLQDDSLVAARVSLTLRQSPKTTSSPDSSRS
jgi:hypothetical protein